MKRGMNMQGIDVTRPLLAIRESARHGWNTLAVGDLSKSPSFDDVALFDRLLENLLNQLVTRLRGPEANYHSIQILPQSLHDDIPILVSRSLTAGQTRYWDDPLNRFASNSGAIMTLKGFFDWDVRAFRDLQYFRVCIAEFPTHQDLVGREALIEVAHAAAILR
jgi:hypothetical protein